MSGSPNLEIFSPTRRVREIRRIRGELPPDKKDELRLQKLVGRVNRWSGIAELASRYTDGGWLFRGQSFPHAMIPSIGRQSARRSATSDTNLGHDTRAEKWIIDQFRRRSRPYLSHVPLHALEWLAVAQHHGLPTRLLDWSESFLAAVFFAVERAGVGGPATIYAMRSPPAAAPDRDPFSLKSVMLYRPPHIAPRIPAQQGVFTVHPRPALEFQPRNLEQWVIEESVSWNIKKQLHACGINESVLFPDIDGLARYLKWRYKRSKSIQLS
jgi:hypothetical protein